MLFPNDFFKLNNLFHKKVPAILANKSLSFTKNIKKFPVEKNDKNRNLYYLKKIW